MPRGHNSVRVLVVDDDEGAREALEELLEDSYTVITADSGSRAIELFRAESFDLVLLDVTMPGMDGIETLQQMKALDKSIDVIMISAIDKAYEAMASIKFGAYEYITKPIESEALLNVVERAVQKRLLEHQVRYLRTEVSNLNQERRIVGQSACMRSVFSLVDKVAVASSNVLIIGESGTGKELIAQAIHNRGVRSGEPFVAINCAAIPSELMESELYGHEKGAFTGAMSRGIGKFEFANNGTVFLDEIGSLKLELQAKLLRFLQEGEFMRVGGNRTIHVDIRMIAATNISLKQLVALGQFREDLYFRLNVIPIELPPLRKRKGDIPLLATYFLDKFNRKLNRKISAISPEAVDVLESYHWPGNIRELENLIERLVVLNTSDRQLEVQDLPFDLLFNNDEEREDTLDQGLLAARRVFERRFIERALRISNRNQAQAAKLLNIHRNTLLQKMKNLHIQV